MIRISFQFHSKQTSECFPCSSSLNLLPYHHSHPYAFFGPIRTIDEPTTTSIPSIETSVIPPSTPAVHAPSSTQPPAAPQAQRFADRLAPVSAETEATPSRSALNVNQSQIEAFSRLVQGALGRSGVQTTREGESRFYFPPMFKSFFREINKF